MAEKFGVHLVEGYGLTEASPVVTAAVGIDAPPGSVGVPVPGMEVRIVDLDGEDVLVGDAGEMLGARPQRVRRVLGGRRGDGPGARPRTAGCTRATSPWSTTTGSCSWWTGPRT